MANKTKGSNAERELLHKFWSTGKWSAIRSAGSGSMKYPGPDLLVGNLVRRMSIECKSSKTNKIYLNEHDVSQLKEFSKVYKVPYEVLNDLIKQSYQDLSLQLKETKSRIVKIKGNYFFIKGPQNPRLTSLIPIHYFDKLELKEEDLELKM